MRGNWLGTLDGVTNNRKVYMGKVNCSSEKVGGARKVCSNVRIQKFNLHCFNT